MTVEELLETVNRLINEVVALRVERWDREWAGGLHREAPPRPKRTS